MPESPLLIYGCGTQGAAIIEWIAHDTQRRHLLLTDDNPAIWGRQIAGRTILPPGEALGRDPYQALCTIGDNATRWRLLRHLRHLGHSWASWMHPSATVAPDGVLGAGSVLMPHVVLNPAARIGAGCLINTGAIVEHHCVLGDAVHLAPGVRLGGGVSIGDGAFLGLGAIVLPGVKIGRFAIIGAGAVVLRDVGNGETAVGNPARRLRHRSEVPKASADSAVLSTAPSHAWPDEAWRQRFR